MSRRGEQGDGDRPRRGVAVRKLGRWVLHWRRANIRRAALMVAGMAGIVALAVPATVLAWRSWRLLLLDDLEITESAAAIQGAAASMGLLATLCLVAVTAWYAFLVRRQMRQAGPDVGVDWFVLWSEPGARPGDMALKSPIESLSKGPIAEGHTEWKIAVEVRNSGNVGTSIQDAGPARLCGIEGCWHRLGSLCHEDAAGFEVGGVGEAVGAAPEHLEQVVYALDAAV